MDITSKSLHQVNFVLVFEQSKFKMPENSEFATLYSGSDAAGARFVDDPAIKTKLLELPCLKLQIVIEPNRLRVEDLEAQEPEESRLINESYNVYQKLFTQAPLIGFGFNFDIYYRFSEVVRLNDLFGTLVDSKILEKADLRDFGIQFTLEKQGGKKRESYFMKITAPIEIVVHINHHFSGQKLLSQPDLQKLFEKCYNEIDEVIQNLKF